MAVKRRTNIFAVLLSVMMLITVIPSAVFADTYDAERPSYRTEADSGDLAQSDTKKSVEDALQCMDVKCFAYVKIWYTEKRPAVTSCRQN